jgi:signal transduction histidine kinase
VIDFKVEIEQIGPLLYDLLNGVNLRQPEEKTEDVLRSILEQVSHQASIDFRPYKSSTILRRIGRRMTVTHNRSMRDYLEYLKTYPVEVGELVKAFLINVTQFFRDPEAFSYLKKDILPDLITKARERDHTLRFWTAGCATGEEPYSLALLIAEMLGEEFSAWNIKIFATDLDEAAITFELFWEEGIPIVRTAHEVYEHGITRTTSRIRTSLPNTNEEIKENYFVYTLVPSHDANGRISGVIIYAVDETEQRMKEIVEEREKLRLIFDHSDMAAFALYDAQTAELIIASSRYLDMVTSTHDMDRSELNGKKWHDMTINSLTGEADRLWQTALEARESVHLPEVHSGTSADKQESVWDYSLIPIYASEKEDNIRFIVVSAIDITKQVQARQELIQLNRIKDDFLSLASHELRTPLTSIMGHSELLQRNLKRKESVETPRSDFTQEMHLLDMIVHQSRRLNHLIEEMMDITRIRSEQLELKHMENVNLVKLVRRVLEQYSDSNREITLVTQEEEIIGNCDEGRLEQVLNNLISNAIKYSEADKPIEVRVERTKHEVTIAVRDEGRGISEEQQRHIFERFYRVHANANTGIEGLGLGLYIAHEIVIRHGGRMWLESRTGQGSTFYFSLPSATAAS